jgi:1-aminocyclopropane-1-carboxylate deaminase/D-cysteine desulfhydrase-like pyridoxal-dependent ACC family enzyme
MQVNNWPLFNVFPKLQSILSPVSLCVLPTSVEPIKGLANHAWVKRDDQTHGIYGGNKTRKFEFIAADINRKKATHVYTIGGTGTNHGVATAMVCQQLELKTTVVTFNQPASDHVNQNQALMKRYGAKVINVGSIIWAGLRYFLNPLRLSKHYYFLPGGGAAPVATFAYVNAALELKQQIDDGLCPEPAEIYVPVGSSSTLAGLTLGCAIAGMKTKVIGIQILGSHVGPIETCTTGTSDKLIQLAIQTIKKSYPEFKVILPPVVLNTSWYGPGYGVLTTVTEQAIEKAKGLGLTLEQTYSGKTFDAFCQGLEKTDKPIMYWATYSSV